MRSRPLRRPRRDQARPTTVALVGTAVGLALAVLIGFALMSPNGLPLRDYQELQALVPDAGNLQPHNEVRVRGVRVGQVIEVDPAGRAARVDLKLDPGVGGVPADSTVAVRARGLLGQRYLEIVPGRSAARARTGATLRGGRNALSFGIPEVLDTFDAETRGGLRATLGGLGAGVVGRGTDVNDALRVVPEGERDAKRFIREVLARDGAARVLLPSLDGASRELEASTPDLAALLRPASAASRPFVDRRAAVRETLSVLPPTLDAARPAFVDGRRLLTSARAVARSVDRTLPAAPAALRETRALLDGAAVPLRRTTALLRRARAAVPPTLRLTDAVRPLLAPIDDALGNLGTIVRTVGPYGCELVNLGDNWHSALGFGQEAGYAFGALHNFRVTAISGPDAVLGLGQSLTPEPLVRKAVYPEPCRTSPGGTYTGDLLPVVLGGGR